MRPSLSWSSCERAGRAQGRGGRHEGHLTQLNVNRREKGKLVFSQFASVLEELNAVGELIHFEDIYNQLA